MLTRLSAWFARQSARRGGLLAVGLGMLSALAFPPLHLLPVLLFAIPGLLRLIRTAPDMRTAMRRGWCFGVGMHVAGLYWLTEAILVEAARYCGWCRWPSRCSPHSWPCSLSFLPR